MSRRQDWLVFIISALSSEALSTRDTPSERACVFSAGMDAEREKHLPVKAARDGCRNVARKGVSREDNSASGDVAVFVKEGVSCHCFGCSWRRSYSSPRK